MGISITPAMVERMRAERTRLGLTQAQMATAGYVSARTYQDWERGIFPVATDFLMAMSERGLDISYVLTGQRSKPVSAANTLPPRQRALIANYEACDEEGRRYIEYTANLAAQPPAPAKRRKAA